MGVAAGGELPAVAVDPVRVPHLAQKFPSIGEPQFEQNGMSRSFEGLSQDFRFRLLVAASIHPTSHVLDELGHWVS